MSEEQNQGSQQHQQKVAASTPAPVKSKTGAVQIKAYRMRPTAQLPKMANEGDGAFDIYTDLEGLYDDVLRPGERKALGTGLQLSFPEGYRLVFHERSGMALKSGIILLGGLIDSRYRDEVKVILLNTSNDIFRIAAGDRVCQCYLEEVIPTEWVEVDQPIEGENRGGGFGSTGA